MLVIADNKLENFANGNGYTYLNSLVLKLYKSNTTPTPATRAGDLTICDFAGYANQNANDWLAVDLDGDATVFTETPVHLFTCTGAGGDIYGYALFEAGGDLVITERYIGAPFAITAGLAFGVRLYFSWIVQV
jgi:hypothetical protein